MWAVFTRTTGGWINCWHDDDKLMHFHTREDAEAELDEHMADLAASVEAGDMTDHPPRSDYLVAKVKAILTVASKDELNDLIDWMHGHQDDDDWPPMTEDAVQWLCGLEVGEHVVADKHVDAISMGLSDWEEVLSNYEDSEPFATELIEVPME